MKHNLDCEDAVVLSDSSNIKDTCGNGGVSDIVSGAQQAMQLTNVISHIAKLFNDNKVSVAKMREETQRFSKMCDTYIASMNVELAKYKERAPMVRKSLEQVDAQINKLLDKAMEIDDDTEVGLKKQEMILDTINALSGKMTAIMMKLL